MKDNQELLIQKFQQLKEDIAIALLKAAKGTILAGDLYNLYLDDGGFDDQLSEFTDDNGNFLLPGEFESEYNLICEDIFGSIDQLHDRLSIQYCDDHPEIWAREYKFLTGKEVVPYQIPSKILQKRVKDRIGVAHSPEELKGACNISILKKMGKPGRDLVAQKLISPDYHDDFNNTAAFVLGELRDKRCIPILLSIACNRHCSTLNRRSATKFLASFHSKEVTEKFLDLAADPEVFDLVIPKLLKYHSPRILKKVLHYIKNLKDPMAVPLLKELKGHTNLTVQKAAIQALNNFSRK